MRIMMTAAMLLLAASASAQTAASTPGDSECVPSAHIDKVTVKMNDGTTRKGSLLCLGPEHLTLAERRIVGQVPLSTIQRIQKAPDPVWDGAAKGALVPLALMLVFCKGDCPAEVVVRTAAAYGLAGLVLDVIDTNTETIYGASAGRRVGVGFRVRF